MQTPFMVELRTQVVRGFMLGKIQLHPMLGTELYRQLTVGSIIHNAGTTFDPSDAASYTYNGSSLLLPSFDRATCLAQLGVTLLVGGILTFIYPWNRISTSFNYPLVVAEAYTRCIVSTNSNAYIFAGQRGRIYITNGSNVDLFKKFPESLSGTVDPYYNWGWAIYWKNQLFFTLSCITNAGVTVSNFAGVWAIDLASEALRLTNSLSYGTYAGTVPSLVNMGGINPTGDSIFALWNNSGGGIDYTTSSPYTGDQCVIDFDLIPIGTFLNPNTFGNLEFKLGRPLVSGESVSLYQRQDLADTFDLVFTTSEVGAISGLDSINWENVQWVQIRIILRSTASSPSYVPLREVRIRN